MSDNLPKYWPSTARHIVLGAARDFYREMNEPWPVHDVAMEQAIENANREIERRQREIYEEASARWINRWESGKLDAEIKKAIEATYGKLRKAERGLRSHAMVKKRSVQLDAEIAQALSRRSSGRSARAHASISGRGSITEDQARTMPRFEFIAHWLAVVTKKKENRDLAKGKRVKHVRGKWQIVYPNGLVEYETPDADRLFDYARRGPLGWHIRNAEEFRGLAYQRSPGVG